MSLAVFEICTSSGWNDYSWADVIKGTEEWVAMLACWYIPTALVHCISTGLSYNHVASVMGAVKNDKTERFFIGKQVGGIGEVKKGTEEWVAILAC